MFCFYFAGSSPESAKDALLQVLTKSGDGLDLDDDCTFYSNPPVKHMDPLLNLEIYNSNFTFLTSHRRASHTGLFEGLEQKNNQRNSIMEEQKSVMETNNSNNSITDNIQRSYSAENVRTSKSAELLDKILSEEDVIVEVKEEIQEVTGQNIPFVSYDQESCNENGSSEVHDGTETQSTSSNAGSKVCRSTTYSAATMPTRNTTGKRFTHVRSASDFGTPSRIAQSHAQPISVSPDSATLAKNRRSPRKERASTIGKDNK